MADEQEKEFLTKAITGLRRKLTVISPDYRIMAARGQNLPASPEELKGQICYRAYHQRETPCENCPVNEVLDTGEPALKEGPGDYPESNGISCLYCYPISEGQSIDGLAVLDFDLPILNRLEEKLYRTNAFMKNLILSAVDGVIAADKSGRIFIFNDAAAEITGYLPDEVINTLNIRRIYPEGRARHVMQQMRSRDHGGEGKLKSYQVDVLSKDGRHVPISLNAAIIYEGEQEVATIGFFHDLRETIRMKKELEKTQIQLIQAEKMASLGKLAAGVAHQLNNPLGGITLFAKLLLEEYDLPDGARQDLDRILDDAQRCRDTVKELLEFTRQTRRFMKAQDINQAILRTLFLLENQSLFQNIDIEKALSSELPWVHGDIQQLNHMFMNIILNAAQAMEGQGRLTIKTEPVPGNKQVKIVITDTGPGIPEDIIPNIFEPFFTTKEEGKGTGLGLSMVYSIVENHGGRITASSPAGSIGATFIIELPSVNTIDQ